MTGIHLQYIFDPLCGWCYACSSEIAVVAERWSSELEMLPCGLFSDNGARMMTPEWARYAWANDQRIANMTGQIFSHEYQKRVLANVRGHFDSTAMNLALTYIHLIDPTLEPRLLNMLQIARYVEGRDTCDYAMVSKITSQFLENEGLPGDEPHLGAHLYARKGLTDYAEARVAKTQVLMRRFDLKGIPQLLVRVADATIPVDSMCLYQGAEKLFAGIIKAADLAKATLDKA